jgi:hypothetical protein
MKYLIFLAAFVPILSMSCPAGYHEETKMLPAVSNGKVVFIQTTICVRDD